ncbi:hypothetical protein E2P81_ATG09786 [Venturia nashicola]|uniref:Uncharacterized protein n=1 Tax=Venturia nashicola TaxID=86259 RepID=A0A4Z1NKC1_9PEZI|nr:hypothetical protein E6O75_ATG10001 [Venturia nashicola]TLD15306.1 hypothetical protein E2P81_ATG09786 [Venturia nashicola]
MRLARSAPTSDVAKALSMEVILLLPMASLIERYTRWEPSDKLVTTSSCLDNVEGPRTAFLCMRKESLLVLSDRINRKPVIQPLCRESFAAPTGYSPSLLPFSSRVIGDTM